MRARNEINRVGRDRGARGDLRVDRTFGGPSGPALPGIRRRAFSLLEVVAAAGIFAIGMVAVLALFTPITKSVSTVSEAESAARVADSILARLQAMPFATVAALLQDASDVQRHDASGSYNPNDGTHAAVIFARLDGEVGLYNAASTPKGWFDATGALLADANKYFEVELLRNETLSPKANDDAAAMLAFTMRVRWPAFLPGSSGGTVQIGANPAGGAVTFDHSKKSVLFFTGSVMR